MEDINSLSKEINKKIMKSKVVKGEKIFSLGICGAWKIETNENTEIKI